MNGAFRIRTFGTARSQWIDRVIRPTLRVGRAGGVAAERQRKSFLSGRPRTSYNHLFGAGRDDAHLVPRPSVRLANASQELPTDGGDCRFVGDRNRRHSAIFSVVDA